MKKQNEKLRVAKLAKRFKQQTLFNSLELAVFAGEWVGIVGKNGAGKSTLAKIICGLERADEGAVLFEGQSQQAFSKKKWAKRVQLITQYSRNALDPTKTVKAILLEPVRQFGLSTIQGDQESVREILSDCQFTETVLTKYPQQLSGGEYQRICVALALLVQPEVLICDEATANLDKITELRILKLLKQKKEMSIVFISHDATLTKNYCDRFICLS